MKVTQITSSDISDFSNLVVICMPDEFEKYNGKSETIYVVESLARAIDLAEVAMDFYYDVLMDDINKFHCFKACHMERGAMMKAFFVSNYRQDQTLILRTDEISESLNAMIEKVFSEK